MILQVPKIPMHSYTLIAVPSERIEKMVSEYTEIESEGQKYKIIERVTILRSQPMPSLLMLLSTGQDVLRFEVLKAYPKSDKIIFFVCEKIDSNTTS